MNFAAFTFELLQPRHKTSATMPTQIPSIEFFLNYIFFNITTPIIHKKKKTSLLFYYHWIWQVKRITQEQ